jgi:putative aminopeptidase FrvX
VVWGFESPLAHIQQNKLLMGINLALFKKLSETPGPSGFEHRIRKLIIQEIKPFVDEIKVDNLGNVIAIKQGEKTNDASKVMVAAHMDELGLMVKHIDSEGFIRFYTLGGFDAGSLVGQRVVIHGKQDIVGVIGTKAVHFMPKEAQKKPLEIEDLYVDLGRDQQEIKEYIAIGDPITRERSMIEMGDCVTGKALDNRTGVFVLIEALKQLKTVPYALYAVFSVQEEVGLRGAQVAAHQVNPRFSLALDTTTSLDMPTTQPPDKLTKLGQGVGIKIMDAHTICDYRMVSYLKQVANENHIAWQPDLKAVGGTDTAPLQRMGKDGAIAGALTVPIRYAHQVVEMVHQTDVALCIQLLVAALSNLDQYDWQHN